MTTCSTAPGLALFAFGVLFIFCLISPERRTLVTPARRHRGSGRPAAADPILAASAS